MILEQVTEFSAGKYYYSQDKWLKSLLEDIITDQASDCDFSWMILLQPKQVTKFMLEDSITARASDWGWIIFLQPVIVVYAGGYITEK